MTGIGPDDTSQLIASEEKRLEEVKQMERIRDNHWSGYITTEFGVPFDDFIDAMKKVKTFSDFPKAIEKKSAEPEGPRRIRGTLMSSDEARRDFNDVRSFLGLPRIQDESPAEDEGELTTRLTRTRQKRRAG